MFKTNFNIPQRFSYSNEFDLARLILALVVVFQHCSVLLEINNIFNFNSIPSVPIFTFISGLFVSESFIFSTSIKKYFIKRIQRILPAYFIVVILGGLLVFLTSAILRNASFPNPITLLKYYSYNLIFLNFKYPCLLNTDLISNSNDCAINGSLWTIKFELLFYILVPLLIYLGRNSKKFFQFLTFTSLIAVSLENNMSIYSTMLFCFLSGVGFSMTRSNWISLLSKIKINSSLRFSLVIFIIILSGGFIPLFLILPLLLLTCFLPTKYISRDIKISKYGNLSYGIYLIHYPIIKILTQSEFLRNLPEFFLIMLILLFTIIGALILYWKVERRFLAKNNYYYKLIS